MPVGGLTLRPSGDNWSWLARCSVPLPPGTREWLGLALHSQWRNTIACFLFSAHACACMTHTCKCVNVYQSDGLMVPENHHLGKGWRAPWVGQFFHQALDFHVNIYSIDLFSELTEKQNVFQGINPDWSVAEFLFRRRQSAEICICRYTEQDTN